MTVNDIFEFLNGIAPVNTACDFDNAGILVGDPSAEVSGAVVALDCTVSAIKTAIKNNCELIITHHPVIFDPLKTVLTGSTVFELIKSGISVISMHTNLDIAVSGVNDCLCRVLGFDNFEKRPASDGYLLNFAELDTPLSADELARHIKEKLGGSVKFTDSGKNIKRVALCSGSGGGYAFDTAVSCCDALVTADVKHNIFIDTERLGISVFDAGHFNTEDAVTEPLKSLLSEKFKTVSFYADHHSEIKYV
jgi:dinuclear metal center YbgI/SA1388 family protein